MRKINFDEVKGLCHSMIIDLEDLENEEYFECRDLLYGNIEHVSNFLIKEYKYSKTPVEIKLCIREEIKKVYDSMFRYLVCKNVSDYRLADTFDAIADCFRF